MLYPIHEEISLASVAICNKCDGPVTPFVILNRAMECAKSGEFSPEALANAVWETYQTWGVVRDIDDSHDYIS